MIHYLRPHLYIYALAPFSDASSNSVMTIRAHIRHMAYLVVKGFLKMFLTLWQVGTVEALCRNGIEIFCGGQLTSQCPIQCLLLEVDGRITYAQTTHSFEPRFRASFGDLDKEECRFTSLILGLLWRRLDWYFSDFLGGFSLSPKSERLGGDLLSSSKVCIIFTSSLDAYIDTARFLFPQWIYFTPIKCSNKCITKFEVCNLFGNRYAAASVWNIFRRCAFNVALITFFRNSSKINCSRVL